MEAAIHTSQVLRWHGRAWRATGALRYVSPPVHRAQLQVAVQLRLSGPVRGFSLPGAHRALHLARMPRFRPAGAAIRLIAGPLSQTCSLAQPKAVAQPVMNAADVIVSFPRASAHGLNRLLMHFCNAESEVPFGGLDYALLAACRLTGCGGGGRLMASQMRWFSWLFLSKIKSKFTQRHLFVLQGCAGNVKHHVWHQTCTFYG